MKLEKSDLQLETIVSRIEAGELDLQPDFQRGEIWDSRRRQRLVDTILRQWYIPAVHIVIDDNRNEQVLDGQQRMAAIRDFFRDAIRIDGNTEPRDESIAALNGLTYSQLPLHVQRNVNRFVLQIISLSDYFPQEPNELFFRLNQSYNLTPPEKRNALHGPARDQVKALVLELSQTGLLSKDAIGFANGRLAYDDIIARTCVAVELGTLRRHINNAVVEDFYRGREFSHKTVQSVRRSGSLLYDLIENSSERVRFNKGTLQTWLVYCYWAPIETGPVPSRLLQRFEISRSRIRSGEPSDPGLRHLSDVLRLYEDRASYRVTDVSSVLARDLALHLFSQAVFDAPGYRGSSFLLNRLVVASSETQAEFFDYLEQSSWGDPLVGGRLVL